MPHSDPQDDSLLARDGRVERVVYTLVFLVLFNLAQTLLWAMALGQVIWTAIHGRPNEHIAEFGARLGVWLKRAALYASGTTDEKPFPWREID